MNYDLREVVGNNDKLLNTCQRLIRLTDNNYSVLIQGEEGTGKEAFAHVIHYQGSRRQGPFIKSTCDNIHPSLKEQLFGSDINAKDGKGSIELAHGGTLFLEDVQNIVPFVQDRLLQFLKEGRFKRVDGSKSIKVDVRLIVAISKDLKEIIKEGKFREDLYFRLSFIPIYLPPLRERKEDIPFLVKYFLEKYNHKVDREIGIHPKAMELLIEHDWPGNIKELENLLKRTIISMTRSEGIILVKHLNSEKSLSNIEEIAEKTEYNPNILNLDLPFKSKLKEVEKNIIIKALEKWNWNQSESAAYLCIPRTSLRYKMKKLGILNPGEE